MKKITSILLTIALTLTLTAGLCLGFITPAQADEPTYDITYSFGGRSGTLHDVRINTDESCIPYNDLAEIVRAVMGGNLIAVDQTGCETAGVFVDDQAHGKVKVISAFNGPLILNVRRHGVDDLHPFTVTCEEHDPHHDPHEDPAQEDDQAGGENAEEALPRRNDSKPTPPNPDTVDGYILLGGKVLPGVLMGKMKQGPIAQAVFTSATPAGWSEAFTFNVTVSGKTDYSLKSGTACIRIPSGLQKEGRQFAILGLDKNGKVKTFPDTDEKPDTVTVNLAVEGFAFDLIHTN